MISLKNIQKKYVSVCQKLSAAFIAPSQKQAQIALFAVGIILLSTGLSLDAMAQWAGGTTGIEYNDERLADATNAILTYIEGTFGAMVMVGAGIMAIMSAAFGQYRTAIGLLIVAVGAFILRSLIGTFFNDENIQA